jgi:hypothetical protein
MRWFQYTQNNSGGAFIGPVFVLVQAANTHEADDRATSYGPVYFGGVYDGIDCECCGDRWLQAYDAGDPEPMLYGQPYRDFQHWRSGDVMLIHGDNTVEVCPIEEDA